MNIQDNIREASKALYRSGVPLLEAELLLCHALKKQRSYLRAYPEQILIDAEQKIFDALVARRQHGEPIAYILGEKEFWSLTLKVTPDTLIPRPETELLVETVLVLLPEKSIRHVVDLGTGSGAIALAIGSERKYWQITATDISEKALLVAKENSDNLGLMHVRFCEGAWCEALPAQKKYDAIVSNPPYIDPKDPHLKQGDVRYEPSSALVSKNHGLKDIELIIQQSKHFLHDHGWLLLEHGYGQGEAVRLLLLEYGYQKVQTLTDLSGLERVSIGSLSSQ